MMASTCNRPMLGGLQQILLCSEPIMASEPILLCQSHRYWAAESVAEVACVELRNSSKLFVSHRHVPKLSYEVVYVGLLFGARARSENLDPSHLDT